MGSFLGRARRWNPSRVQCCAQDYRTAVAYVKTDLAAQAGLAISIVRHRIPYASLPVRINMWSWPAYARAFANDFSDVRLLHYLHHEVFSKSRDIENVAVEALVGSQSGFGRADDALYCGRVRCLPRRGRELAVLGATARCPRRGLECRTLRYAGHAPPAREETFLPPLSRGGGWLDDPLGMSEQHLNLHARLPSQSARLRAGSAYPYV